MAQLDRYTDPVALPMLRDPYLRQLAASLGAWLSLVFCLPTVWALSTLDINIVVAAPVIVGSFLTAVFAPWLLVDAILLRPILLQRTGWIWLAPIECLSLCAYRCLLQWHVIASGGGISMIVLLVKDMLVLYAGYVLCSVLLLYLLSRHAARFPSPPN